MSSLFNPFDSGGNSTANETSVAAADQGQANFKSTVLQGASKGAQGTGAIYTESGSQVATKGSKIFNGGLDLSKTKIGKGGALTVNLAEAAPPAPVSNGGGSSGGGTAFVPSGYPGDGSQSPDTTQQPTDTKPTTTGTTAFDLLKGFFTSSDGTTNYPMIGIVILVIVGGFFYLRRKAA